VFAPAGMRGMVKEAVDGDPLVTVPVPALTPSSKKTTVPVGFAARELEEVIAADTSSELPPVGVSVAGVTTIVLALLPTVRVTAAEAEDA